MDYRDSNWENRKGKDDTSPAARMADEYLKARHEAARAVMLASWLFYLEKEM